jgi:serine/threonine protein kinase
MLHRDIKPHNILLTPNGAEAKITDFGLACLVSSAAANSRAGTLAYSSAEKAGARGYDSKDDMWAVGCILSELLTNTPIPSRCGGGVFAFNPSLVQKTIEDSIKASPHLGRIVAQLLALDPANRPTAKELLLMLEPSPTVGLDVDDAEELCEEYLCAICQNLVLDAHTACPDEHVFCRSCLLKWLDTKNECPTCRKVALNPKP